MADYLAFGDMVKDDVVRYRSHNLTKDDLTQIDDLVRTWNDFIEESKRSDCLSSIGLPQSARIAIIRRAMQKFNKQDGVLVASHITHNSKHSFVLIEPGRKDILGF